MNRLFAILSAVTLFTGGPIHAHELSIDWTVRNGDLAIRATSDDLAAAGATVEVRSAEGQSLAKGILDEQGRWTWRVQPAGKITIVVDAGLGHRETLTLTDDQLRSSRVSHEHADLEYSATETGGMGGAFLPGEKLALKWRVLLGLSLLAALAASWMSLSNARRITRLEHRFNEYASRG